MRHHLRSEVEVDLSGAVHGELRVVILEDTPVRHPWVSVPESRMGPIARSKPAEDD
jgi:hypothetical protein